MPGSMPRGLRLIISYKLAKALTEFLGGAIIFALGSAGSAARLTHVAQAIHRHATEHWSIVLAERLMDASTAHNVFVVALSMVIDGIATSIEGWALYRRFVWSRWLVVGTTAALLPFEIIALVHHPNAGRAAVFLVNLLIVLYLLQRHESDPAGARGEITSS
jgi:GTP-binding protein